MTFFRGTPPVENDEKAKSAGSRRFLVTGASHIEGVPDKFFVWADRVEIKDGALLLIGGDSKGGDAVSMMFSSGAWDGAFEVDDRGVPIATERWYV